MDLSGIQSEEREHPPLLGDEPVADRGQPDAPCIQTFHEQTSHLFDASSHGVELIFPLGGHLAAIQDRGDDGGAVGCRVGVGNPGDKLQLTEHGCRDLWRSGTDGQRTDPLVVEREVLREAGADDHLVCGLGQG